jgi:signal transduction histidine kinase
VERIDGTVRALLDRARPRTLHRERTSVTELTGRAVNVARAQLGTGVKGKHVRVQFEPPAHDLVLSIDPSLIEDSILNLIINAIEAVPDDGRVRVEIRKELNDSEPEHIQDEAIIEVSDNGCGIAAEDLTRIFNPFFTTTDGGTGLGLPAVRRIVRVHGGRIDVSSTIGEGSTFTIRLPVTN